MIRKYAVNDIEAVVDIWLSASIKAHDFVEASFWKSQVDNMINVYIPDSETYVYVEGLTIVGFYSLHGNNLAAIFVSPEYQGHGFGKKLMAHAKNRRMIITLSVYKENRKSYQFYLAQGFKVISEQVEEHTGHMEYIMITKT